jgi:fibronectin type 3 domain-containing protein
MMDGIRKFWLCVFSCLILVCLVLLAFGNLAAQGVPSGTAHSVSLTWVAPSPVGGSGTISGYNVYRAPSSTGVYSKLNTALTAGLTYTDTSVSAGASYNYCVTTVDSLAEESMCSAPATANVPANPNAPSAPLVTTK